MRTIPGSDDPLYVSMTAADLIAELQKLDPNAIVMQWDGHVILNIAKDTVFGLDVVYLVENL